MSQEKSGPHIKLEGERQEAHDEALASVQDSNSGHVEHTAQEQARDSERPSPSPQLPTHEKAHDSEKSSSGPQPPPHDEAQDSAEKPSLGPQPPTHGQAHDFLERPSCSSQPPMHKEAHSSEKSSHSSQPTQKQEQRASKRKARRVRANTQRDEERERIKQERRRLENERRLEGQRLEYERKIEARRKAEAAAAAAAARAQSKGEGRSTDGGGPPQPLPGSEEALRVQQRRQHKQSLMEESVKAECREDAEGGSPTVAIKMDDDQKAHLIMMAHSASTISLASPPITVTPRDPSDPASSHSDLGYCYYGKDEVTRQCQYWCQCGLVRDDLREDSQTGTESNYLFDPPLLRWPSPKPVESVQTRQDATDVLFQPSLERSEDSAGTDAVVTVIIPRVKAEYFIRNNGVSTVLRRTTSKEVGPLLDEAVTRASVRGEEVVEVGIGMKCPDKSN